MNPNLKMIEQLRKEIDKIDEEIMSLLKKRLDAAEKIAEEKKKAGVQVYDQKREEQVIEKAKNLARQKGIPEESAEQIFSEIIKQTRKHEHDLRFNIRKNK